MNARVVTAIVGLVTLGFGLAGLLYPGPVMGLLGFSVLDSTQSARVLGEVRATYGGIFVVLGIYTLLSAMDPAAHRGRLLLIGLLWLGACGGRLMGVSINGNPGLPGWAAAVGELVIGGALVAAAMTSNSRPSALAAPMTPVRMPPATTTPPALPPAPPANPPSV